MVKQVNIMDWFLSHRDELLLFLVLCLSLVSGYTSHHVFDSANIEGYFYRDSGTVAENHRVSSSTESTEYEVVGYPGEIITEGKNISTIFEAQKSVLVTRGVGGVKVEPYFVETNRWGLREERFEIEKPENTTRILLMGDSYAFGWGVNRSNRFADIVETKLNERRKTQVIVAAVPNWGMEDYRNYWQEQGKRLNPDIVVVAVVGNDELAVEKTREIDESSKTREERRNRMKEYIDRQETRSNSPLRRGARSMVKNTNAKWLFYQVTGISKHYDKLWKDLEDKKGTEFVSVPKKLDREQDSEYILHKDDRHWNEKGHRWLAEKLYSELRNLPAFQVETDTG